MGGISIGEGAWRLVPLSREQAYTFFVPFLTADLGDGVWSTLKNAAKQDGVTVSLRGMKSSGRHDSVDKHRSLAAYGLDVAKVQHHVGQILDAAQAAGIDPTLFQLPDHWFHSRFEQLPKRPLPTLPPSLLLEDAFEPEWCDSPESLSSTEAPSPFCARISFSFFSVGTRFLSSFPGFDGLSERDRRDVTAIANAGQHSKDPGEDQVTRALQMLGIPVDFSISAMACHDPAADTKHIGLSFGIQSRMLELHLEWLRGFFSRVKEASRAAMGRRPTLAIAVYCKSGRHRSVAGVEIATHVLRSDGCVVIAPAHTCDYWWRWRGCQNWRRGCKECTSGVDARKAALYAQAAAMWREA